MTTPWLNDTALAQPAPMLGWWAVRPEVDFLRAAGKKAGAATATQTATYSHSTVGAALSDMVMFLAMPGSFAGAYNWVATIDGDPLQYVGYAPIGNNVTTGVVAMYLARNIPSGSHAMSATLTAGSGDAITALYAASVAYEAGALTGSMSWYVDSTQAVAFSDATNLPPGNKLVTGMFANGGMSSAPASNPSGLVTRYTADAKFHIYETPTTGDGISWSGNQSVAGGWAEVTTGVVA